MCDRGGVPNDPAPEPEPTPTPAGAPVDAPADAEDDDGPRPTLTWARIVALVAAFAWLGGAVGYLVASRDPSPSAVDVGFRIDMITHHQQALAMSFDVLEHGTDPTVRSFAREIIQQQSLEVGVLEQQLRDVGRTSYDRPATAMAWMGHPVRYEAMPGLATDAQLRQLHDATGAEADRLFLHLMAVHHLAGADMATYAAEHGRDGELRDLAYGMARNQLVEINEMRALAQRDGISVDLPPEQAIPAARRGDQPAAPTTTAAGRGADDDMTGMTDMGH